MAFPDDPLDVTIEAAFGADRTADPDTWVWTDLTGRWHDPDVLTAFTGRREGARQAEAGDITLTFKNTDGQLTPEDPRSQWWPHVDEGLPIRVTLDPGVGDPLVFGGFASSITPRWPGGSAGQALVDVVAGGVIRQYARGRSPLRPALHRATPLEPAVVACWPLAGLGQFVTQAPSATAGAPMAVTKNLTPDGATLQEAFRWSADTTGAGLGALPTMGVIATGVGLTAPVTAGPSGRFGWSVWGRGFGSDLDSDLIMWVDTEDLTWLVWPRWNGQVAGQITVTVEARDPDLNLIARLANDDPIPTDDRWRNFAVVVEQQGGDAAVTVLLDGVVIAASVTSGSLTGVNVGQARQVRASPALFAGDGQSIGYPTVLSGASVAVITTAITGLYSAGRGHIGEPAIARAQRLCEEEGVPVTVVGTAADSELMGPQHPATFLELLRECERTDDGILAEQVFSFWLRTRISRYNQDPALLIDAAQRQLGRQFEPVRDDQRVRNEWTVSNRDGGEITALDGPDQQRRGRKDDTLTVNVGSVQRVVDRAHWELSRSILRALRYPMLPVHLHSSPALLAQVMATRLGDRVQVVNPPAQHPPGPVDQVVEGIRHTIRGRRAWTWEAVVAPYAPWQVGIYADDEETPAPDAAQRYDTAGSVTAAAFTAGTDTALDVETTLGPSWTTDSADLPLDVRAFGVQLRVIAIGEPAISVRDTTSGVDTGGTSYAVAAPTHQAGDVLVAIQSASTDNVGITGDPTGGWTPVLSTASLGVWWKVAGGSEPSTYTFSHGSTDLSVAAVIAVDGARPGMPPLVRVQDTTGSGTTVDTPPGMVFPHYGPGLELRWAEGIQFSAGSPTWTPPGGYTEREEMLATDIAALAATLASRELVAGDIDATGRTATETFTASETLNGSRRGVTLNLFGAVQTMTVQQTPVNGVVKPVPVGSDVALWAPARYAL